MSRSHLLISAAWVVQGTAWFLPAFGSEPGWLAFLMASSAFTNPVGGLFDRWYEAVLAAASVGTTIFFVFGSLWALSRGSRRLRRVFAWIAATAFLINGHWLIGGLVSNPGIGYFLWWWSFLLLAAGLFDLAGANEAAGTGHS